MSTNFNPFENVAFFQAFDEEINTAWIKYLKSEEYKYGKPSDHADKLLDILDMYRSTKSVYNWKYLPGAGDDFSLFREYTAAYEPNVDRTSDIDSFIEEIKEQPEKLWYFMAPYLYGADELSPKAGLRTSPRAATTAKYAQYGGFADYEGAEVTIFLEINEGKELPLFSKDVHITLAARYFNAYSGDWLDEEGFPSPGFDSLSVSKFKSIDPNPLDGCGARVNTTAWNGNATECPNCGAWFNKALDTIFTKEEVEGKSKAEILSMFAVQAGIKRREETEKRRKQREQRRSTYEERIKESREKDRKAREREEKRREAYTRKAIDRCGELGIDLGPDETGKEPAFLDVKQLLVSLLEDAAEQGSHRKHRYIEITLEAVRSYYCFVLVDKDACDDVDDNG